MRHPELEPAVKEELFLLAEKLARAAKDYSPESVEAKFLNGTAEFFCQVAQNGAGLQYFPPTGIDQALSLLSPYLELEPVANPDIAFEWSQAISEDMAFRWDDYKHKRGREVRVFSSPLLMSIRCVLAENTLSGPWVAKDYEKTLLWETVTPEMITFAAAQKEDKSGDWFYDPEGYMQRNWLNFTDWDGTPK